MSTPTSPSTPAHAKTGAGSAADVVLTIAGVAMLLIWALWWAVSFAQPVPRLITSQRVLITMPTYAYLGIDFVDDYAAIRTWHNGGNPFIRIDGDPLYPRYNYPAPALLLFLWTGAFPPDLDVIDPDPSPGHSAHVPYSVKATLVWFVASVLMVVVSVAMAGCVRRAMGLSRLPTVLMVALTLASYPVIFDLERGNFNVAVLVLLALACGAGARLWRRGWGSELLAGAAAGFAATLKVFPLIALPGLIVVRRFVAAVSMCVTMALLWAAMWGFMADWLKFSGRLASVSGALFPKEMHSLVFSWKHLWAGTPLAGVSPIIGTLVLLIVPCGVVSWKVFWSGRRDELGYPFLLWLTAMGTCAMATAVDYNLLFLVVATLAVWDRRDPWWVHVLLLPWVWVWQPFQVLPAEVRHAPWIGGVFFAAKLWSLLAVGVVIVWRARDVKIATTGGDGV